MMPTQAYLQARIEEIRAAEAVGKMSTGHQVKKWHCPLDRFATSDPTEAMSHRASHHNTQRGGSP